MQVQYWAGTITPEAVNDANAPAWARAWYERATAAGKRGNILVAFEVPKDEIPDIAAYGADNDQVKRVQEEMQFTDLNMLQAFLRTCA